MKQPLRVAVIGGGISGLSAAYRIQELAWSYQQNIELSVLEAGQRFGGVINTYSQADILLETGPDSFITQKPQALELCRKLGIAQQVIPTNQEHRRTYVASGQKIHPLPDGFLMMAPTKWLPFLTSPLFSFSGKCRMAMDLWLPPKQTPTDESLAAFVRRRFGQEALTKIAQPMVGGIYTADPEKLSLYATMPRFLELERKYGSVIRGLQAESNSTKQDSGARYSLFASLDKGMQVMVDALVKKLPPQFLQLNSAVERLEPSAAQGWNLLLKDGRVLNARAVVLALPAHQSARLLSSIDTDLSSHLSGIAYASSVVLNLVFRRQDIPQSLDGFGFVVPAAERRNILACTFSSVKFAGRSNPEQVVLRVFMGGAMQPENCTLSDEQLTKLAREDLACYLGITMPPLLSMISRHPFSMPQYHVGHLARLKSIESRLGLHQGLALCGNAYTGVGIPDCIASGQQAAENIMRQLFRYAPAATGNLQTVLAK